MDTVTITLYRKRYNNTLRDDTWTSTQYSGVHWYGGDGIKILNNRYKTDDSYTVRIFTPEHIDVQLGDVVALGQPLAKVPSELPRTVPHFTAVNVVDNRRGSLRMQHFKIGGA